MNAFKIEGPLTVQTAETWRQRLAAHLGSAAGLTIDVEAVAEWDAFGLQLLWSARRSAIAAGRPFVLRRAGEAFARACAQTGFAPAAFASSPDSP